jgi:hypothetical protein
MEPLLTRRHGAKLKARWRPYGQARVDPNATRHLVTVNVRQINIDDQHVGASA